MHIPLGKMNTFLVNVSLFIIYIYTPVPFTPPHPPPHPPLPHLTGPFIGQREGALTSGIPPLYLTSGAGHPTFIQTWSSQGLHISSMWKVYGTQTTETTTPTRYFCRHQIMSVSNNRGKQTCGSALLIQNKTTKKTHNRNPQDYAWVPVDGTWKWVDDHWNCYSAKRTSVLISLTAECKPNHIALSYSWRHEYLETGTQ